MRNNRELSNDNKGMWNDENRRLAYLHTHEKAKEREISSILRMHRCIPIYTQTHVTHAQIDFSVFFFSQISETNTENEKIKNRIQIEH